MVQFISVFKKKLLKSSQILSNILSRPKKYIYLTFDDGPLPGTQETFNLCSNLRVKASYFMVGCHNQTSQTNNLIKSIIANSNNFIVGNHSFSHADEKYKIFYQNPIAALDDFEKSQNSLCLDLKLARLPGYSAWSNNDLFKGPLTIRPLSQLLIKKGYSIYGWDIEWKFNQSALKLQENDLDFRYKIIKMLYLLKTNKKNHIVVLLHDISFRHNDNLLDLKALLLYFRKSSKYVFETIDKYPL